MMTSVSYYDVKHSRPFNDTSHHQLPHALTLQDFKLETYQVAPCEQLNDNKQNTGHLWLSWPLMHPTKESDDIDGTTFLSMSILILNLKFLLS